MPPPLELTYLRAHVFSIAASRMHNAIPSDAMVTSSSDGKVGASRRLLSCGSCLCGQVEPAVVSARPASAARATTCFAVPGVALRLMN